MQAKPSEAAVNQLVGIAAACEAKDREIANLHAEKNRLLNEAQACGFKKNDLRNALKFRKGQELPEVQKNANFWMYLKLLGDLLPRK